MYKPKISIIGAGYVGLPLALEFGKKFQTNSIEISKKRLLLLDNKIDPGGEIKLNEFNKSKFLKFSNSFKSISDLRFYNYYNTNSHKWSK